MDAIQKLLSRGVEEVIVREHLERALRAGKKLRVKLGIDPTAPDLHLGHTVVLRKLREFQDLGHKVVLIIGDFTAQIGDPSGRSEERKPLSEKEIRANLRHYLAQAGKVVNVRRAEIRRNSEWHRRRGLRGLLELTRLTTVQQVMKRDDFEKRLRANMDISVLETLYPLLQGYDSVAVKSDVELGGTDQTFNLLMGRRVERAFRMPEQDILTVPLLEGIDGVRKMSKSYGNAVALTEKPATMFGKLMAIPDALTAKYFTLLTDRDVPKGLSARDEKLALAETIVGEYHSPAAARRAREEFLRVFSRREAPAAAPPLKVPKKRIWIIDLLLLAGIPSKSEARRLIVNGAVSINHAAKRDPQEILALHHGDLIRLGKHRFFKIL